MLVNELIGCVQDCRSMFSALLTIQEALETGIMPKSFLIYNDGDIYTVMRHIAELLKTKYGVKVPESEL